jgi:superfamily I DNA and/or RNA helicase/serine/threonine protein kinase
MEIRLIKKTGVPNAEVGAHQIIQKEFSTTAFSDSWRGYAAFALARRGSGSGDDDFDLVLVTHANIALIELKNWHGKLLESDGRKWFLDGEDRGPSPVDVVNLKVKKLASVMTQKLGVERTPFIKAYVVMHGNIERMELKDDEKQSVLSMTELLSFRFEDCYKRYFWGKPKFNPLDYLPVYDKFFEGPAFKPKDYLIDGFRPESMAIFEHPQKLYSEFRAHAKDDSSTLALLRQWDFGALGLELIGENDRSFIGLREQKIFQYISERNEELSLSLLRPISRKIHKDVTLDFAELFALPGRVTRLTEFVHRNLPKLDPEERLTLVKAVLSRFADLHDLNVAHRDVGDYCLWVDRPAKVVMAGFSAAYYPEIKTVGTFREKIKVEQSVLPEDLEAKVQPGATPYRRDVFMLGALVYLILYGEKPPRVEGIPEWGPRADDPYNGKLNGVLSCALSHDVKARFANARELLHGLNVATLSEQESIIDFRAFNAFSAETKERDYDVLESLIDEEGRSFYRSEAGQTSVVVKIWFSVKADQNRPDYSLRLLSFLERSRAIKGCAIDGIPKVIDFGFSRGSLLLVLEWVGGATLDDWLKESQDLALRLCVSRSLVDALQRLHTIEIAHGDIHPGNIVVKADGSAVLIDVLDFRPNTDDVYTTAYLPDHYKSLTPFERDRYSLAAVLVELLGSTRAQPGQGTYPIPSIYNELSNLLKAQTFSTFEPLANAIRNVEKPEKEEIPEFNVIIKNLGYTGVSPGEMRSDNGFFHISVDKDRKTEDAFRFRVTGIGRQVIFVWKRGEECANWVQAKTITQSQLLQSQTWRDAAIKMRLNLLDGPATDAQSLVSYVVDHQAFQRKIAADALTVATTKQAKLIYEEAQSPNQTDTPVRKLWQAFLDTEEDAFFTITIAGEKRFSPSRENQILISYHADQRVIDYEASDKVMVESQMQDGTWRNCGQLNLRESTFGQISELAIDNPSQKESFRIGCKLRLVSTLDKSSFTRRRSAVDRILQNKAIVPNLIQFFDASKSPPPIPTIYPIPSDADLAHYSDGDRKLNPSQKAAFRKVVSHGPISLLQGPPGTGKTWFIAALLHYLMTTERARRILLVSQAHEAVNNALEKAQELCRTKNLIFDAVRLGNEAAASDAIRHLHASSIEQSYRERFKAEQRERIVCLAASLGLPKSFTEDIVDLHLRLGMLADRISKLELRRQSEDEQGISSLDARIHALTETFRQIATAVYDFSEALNTNDALEQIEKSLIANYEIQSPDALDRLHALIRLSDDWLNTLGSPNANFDEFLAKSRTVVSGTLVGIGYRGAGVVQNIYDWVIIDEAGRAAPSELAVAMQAGRRILLVGDHRQLPPTFTEEVRDAMKAKFAVEDDSLLFGSDFERIFNSDYGRRVGTKLLTQYRMAPDIGDLVSTCFYDGELESGRGIPPEYYELLPENLSKQVNWIDISSIGQAGEEQISEDRRDKWNEAEARCVMGVLKQIIESEDFMEFLSDDLQPMEPAIGIICMYRKQRELIDRMKTEATWLSATRGLVKVDTVDSYQGKENRIVILSTVRNNPRYKSGFLSSTNRINVALSRAMDRLIVVGATKMWTRHNEDLPLGKVLKKIEAMVTEGRASILNASQFLEN